jgi:hypothetical protein
MFATGVEDLDFTVQRIPGIKPSAAVTTPPSLTASHAKIFKLVQYRGPWNSLWHFREANLSL